MACFKSKSSIVNRQSSQAKLQLFTKNYRYFLGALGLLCCLTCANPFAPGLADGTAGGSAILTEQRNPSEVLTNFQYAYTFKDSLVYSELLDSAFIFISTNFSVSPPEPINWGRDTELRTVGRMFGFFNTLDLTWNATGNERILEIDQDSMALRIEQKINFTLTLDGGSAIPTLIGEVLFEFIRREERWFLIRWEDLQV